MAAAIRNMENLTVTDSTITGNATSDPPFVSYESGGGGIYNAGHLTVVRSTITNNSTARDGGAIRSVGAGSVVVVTDSTISGNTAGRQFSGEGGGIAVRAGGSLTVSGSTISGNSSNSVGGGISLQYGGTVTVTDSTISGNSTQARGGGISEQPRKRDGHRQHDQRQLGRSKAGGGIHSYHGSLTVVDSTISDNSAVSRGGGIDSQSGNPDGHRVHDQRKLGRMLRAAACSNILGTARTITDSTISGNSRCR